VKLLPPPVRLPFHVDRGNPNTIRKTLMMNRILATTLSTLAFLSLACAQPSLVNFSHLRHLTETILLGGDSVDIVHVYANYPDYGWREAADAGTEGVACVDDAARAAVLYLRHYELSGNNESLTHARALLSFVLKMQTDDGEFYNFIHRDYSINKTGRTSLKSFGWWASRGVWCLGTGYRVFRSIDPVFGATLKRAMERSLPRVHELLARYGERDTIAGFPVPRWLPYGSGSDVTSEMLLGLVAYTAAEADARVNADIGKLADGIMVMQSGTPGHAPYGAYRSWETLWHMWGNAQMQALALAGEVLDNSEMVASARREADGWYSRLLIDGFMKEWNLASADPPPRYEQIAYAVRPMVLGLLRVYEARGNRDYLVMAGLAASWFSGNNVLRSPMYDPATGRGYDGIRDSVTMNRNSGAESTIEALSTLLEIERFPEAGRFLAYRKTFSGERGEYHAAVFRDTRGGEVTLRIRTQDGAFAILEGDASKRFWSEQP
jgi:hypothetical protein